MSVKILLVGSAVDRHLIRLVTNIKANDNKNDIIFDVLHTNPQIHANLEYRLPEIEGSIRYLYTVKRHFGSHMNKISVVTRFIDIIICLSRIKRNEYDVVNIHYMSPYYFPVWSLLKRKGRKIMISPLGSDVYRVGGLKAWMIKQCYKKTDYVSAGSDKFKNDIRAKFHISPLKFVSLGFGSTMNDKVFSNTNLSKEEAKNKLGLSGNFVIVCGYNGSPGQQHLKIISALSMIRERFPENFILIFPMTYAKREDYTNEVRQLLDSSLLPYIIYDNYLKDDDLFCLRKCADIFIHVQITDAFCASVQEYLLCDVTVINGEWIRYPDLEKWGIPYILINSISDLAEKVCKVVEGREQVNIPEGLKLDIISRGYSSQAEKWLQFYTNIAE